MRPTIHSRHRAWRSVLHAATCALLGSSSPETAAQLPPERAAFALPPVRAEATVAAAFFHSEAGGDHPGGDVEFDEARLTLESRLAPSLLALAEIDGVRREEDEHRLRLGEAYLTLHAPGDEERTSLRLGRLPIPVGEEYRSRGALANPLVSHSLMDLHGYDEGAGLRLRGDLIDLETAAQSGGPGRGAAFAGCLGYTPLWWLRLSLSAYRGGIVDDGRATPLRVGGEKLRPPLDTDYRTDLIQADIRLQWESGHLHGALGRLRMRGGAEETEARYGQAELAQEIFWGLYAAARYSRIEEPEAGGPGTAKRAIDRLSLGLGFRRHEDLVFKAEYAFEDGEIGFMEREGANIVSLQAATRF